MREKTKSLGQVFTPSWVVNEILDSVGYFGENILEKFIMEPSSGDGAFLREIIVRYLKESKKAKLSEKQICTNLEKYIYAIEIDPNEYKKSLENLNEIVSFELQKKININWKIFNENTLYKYKEYKGMFDFVVGNPPYIRIHNLDTETREYIKEMLNFTEGTIDIYLSFFEIGFQMLKKDGKLGYITPNSFLHNSSYRRFRNYLKETCAIKKLIDFKSSKVFDGFSTYNAISIIQFNDKKEDFEYCEFENGKIKVINHVRHAEIKGNNWSFSDIQNSSFVISMENGTSSRVGNYFNVQYGFATLRDKIYIGDVREFKNDIVYFNNHPVEKEILKKIVKGSTFKGSKEEIKYIIFPYKQVNGRSIAINEEELENKFPFAYKYLLNNKDELLARDIDKGSHWYEFGRSQGIQTMFNEKIVCSTLAKDFFRFYRLPEDVMVYSGIFITKKNSLASWEMLSGILQSENFMRYIKITGKDFSGGYKSITSKQIKQFKLPGIKVPNLFDFLPVVYS